MIFKNTAGQGVYFYASDKTTGLGLAGDQANISGTISKDGAAPAAFATATPTNIGGGWYWQPLSQAETNAGAFAMKWTSTTANILIAPMDVYTEQGRIDAAISSRSTYSGGVVAGVSGDVGGKVLGGGSGTITGTGANAYITGVAADLGADGTAQGGGTSTITLASSASSVDDAYNGRAITIVAGTGAGQGRKVTDYAGSTRVATVDSAWATQPDSTSKYALGDYAAASGESGGADPQDVAAAVAAYEFTGDEPAGSIAGTLGAVAELSDIGTTVGGVLDARGVTQGWVSRLLNAAKWGPTNKRVRTKLTGNASRFDLIEDNGTTVGKTQTATDDGQGNQSMGAQA